MNARSNLLRAAFHLPYKRPNRLSDPFNDFLPEKLRQLLDTPDEALNWTHYRMLFQAGLPAGNYEECAYFLPRAFDFIIQHEDTALEWVGSLIWWVSYYDESLRKDGARKPTREALTQCLRYWTRDFSVIHWSKDTSVSKGWTCKEQDFVARRELVVQAVADLIENEVHRDIASQFCVDLSHNAEEDPVKAAWFLAFVRSRDEAYAPPNYAPINELLVDRELILRNGRIVMSSKLHDETPRSYWRDTFRAIGLEGYQE